MKHIEEFRNNELTTRLVENINNEAKTPIKLMEVCGTHTVNIAKFGIKSLISSNIKLTSGPGCPVCVTNCSEIDTLHYIAGLNNIILCTYGDMMKVPGSNLTLNDAKSTGADVRVVYSALNALNIAKNNSDKTVVFAGVGFETTTPASAHLILEAESLRLNNILIYSMHKLVPPALTALASSGDIALNGLILPGHVSTIIGACAYNEFIKQFSVPSVITGFEALDILQSILMLLKQINSGRSGTLDIQYNRAVNNTGNLKAINLIKDVFEKCDTSWRGIGNIPNSGLKIKSKYSKFDALVRLEVPLIQATEPKNCLCGNILKGISKPEDCMFFGNNCTPDNAIGPCMVSGEGACAAAYKYGGTFADYGA